MRNRFVTTAGIIALLVGATGVAVGQGVIIEPVDFRPFADGRNWIVKQALTYKIGVSHDSVVVPVGFVTDMASIPPALQSFIQQNGPYMLPAVVHDYLYWMQTCTRDEADQILLLGMIEAEVEAFDREAIFNTVRAAGQFAWKANAKERAKHLLRVLPPERLQVPTKTLWPQYRAQLVQAGVASGPENAIPAGFCARGRMSVKDALETP